MRYWKEIADNYIVCIGTGGGNIAITEDEYNSLMQRIKAAPKAPEGYAYMLRADTLEWELLELPPMPETEPTTDEVIDYLFGGDAE